MGKLHTWVRIPPDAFMKEQPISRIPDTNIFVGKMVMEAEPFVEAGVKTVFTMGAPELLEKEFRNKGMTLIRLYAQRDLSIANIALKFLARTKNLKGKFAITCPAGLHTSRAFAGLYLLSKGWSLERIMKALGKMNIGIWGLKKLRGADLGIIRKDIITYKSYVLKSKKTSLNSFKRKIIGKKRVQFRVMGAI